MKSALIVFLKEPVAGRVKTRLCPPLTHEEASSLYQCFVSDALSQYARLSADRFDMFLSVTPQGAVRYFEDLIQNLRLEDSTSSRVSLVCQSEGNLGERMLRAFQDVLEAGYNRAVLIGSDHPTLPDEYIQEAFARLDDHCIVIGPSRDGGYYLLGLTHADRTYFCDIPWSSDSVFQVSLERFRRKGQTCAVLKEWYDVDDAESLSLLQTELFENGSTKAPWTSEWVKGYQQSLQTRSYS